MSRENRLYNIFRAVIISLIIIVVAVPAGLYLILSTPWAQDKLRDIGQEQLSRLLGTEVTIGAIDFEPFDRVTLSDVVIKDDYGKEALSITTLSSRFETRHFLSTGELSFDYARIDGMNAHLYKPTKDSALNIANIIARLKPKDKTKPPTKFTLDIGLAEITNSTFRYDILDAPATPGRFNPSHISVTGLNLVAYLPLITHEGLKVELPKLTFDDASGLGVTNISLTASILPGDVSLEKPVIELAHSRLEFGSIHLHPDSLQALSRLGRTVPTHLSLEPGSYVTLSDLAPLTPRLKDVNRTFDLDLDITGTIAEATLDRLNIRERSSGRLNLSASGRVFSPTKLDSLTVSDFNLSLTADGREIAGLFSDARHASVNPRVVQMLTSTGVINLEMQASGSMSLFDGHADVQTEIGAVSFDGTASSHDKFKTIDLNAAIDINHLDMARLTNNANTGPLTANAEIKGAISRQATNLTADIVVSEAWWRGIRYTDLNISGDISPDKTFDVETNLSHELGNLSLNARGNYDPHNAKLIMSADIRDLDLYAMHLTNRYQGYKLSATVDADLTGDIRHRLNGHAGVYNLSFVHPEAANYPPLRLDNLVVSAIDNYDHSSITVTGDWINGQIEGQYDLSELPHAARHLMRNILPAFFADECHTEHLVDNNFTYHFTVDNTDVVTNFLRAGIRLIYPMTIEGRFDGPGGVLDATIDAPYLLQGDKLIEESTVQLEVNSTDGIGRLYATSHIPTKKGPMVLVADMSATDNRIDSRIDWQLLREKPVNGILAFSTLLGKDTSGRLAADVDFNPCQINFGNDVWQIAPCHIAYSHKLLNVEGFKMFTPTQSISIDGTASDSPLQNLMVNLDNVELINIFETLDINKALLGGTATGQITARGLFSPTPDITTNSLVVDSISYNYCVLGNAVAQARWNVERRCVDLKADLTEPEGGHSYISGSIMPMTQELDITFDANNVRAGFLKPFMSAFAEDVTGHASGHAHLFGTFKHIDLEGDIFARDFGVKIAFTNTWYHTTDSVHITPGSINIQDVTITDPMGHTAKLNGYVKHTFFKDPEFDFAVSEAQDFLSYDVTPKLSPDWYGRVFGNGSAFINGHPGVVNISVNMSTAPGSTFTFVLSDLEEATEYSFITFRDRHVPTSVDTVINRDRVPAIVREIQKRAQQEAANSPSDYNMDIQVDITPDARMIIVMDPVGGDEIKATGKGNLRMTYSAPANDLKMYGSYTIEHGTYNFTLQDIIVKDFTIKDGSSITFTGDPYSARLDIKAAYAVNANLSDLDESFLQDKELNRTNVPVNALLLVNGDMRQPDITFDLEFPTLSSDTYRKVRSIISTDEMMDRQIIYLLALNRFYTPEYMSATKGNELFSVASSTISSRLSSMLGKLSENWTIAPNLRSDKGDFSDVEFDLALTSSLLNNRLKLNGNFGYRDKALNSNQFIGDFDIEYLLTPNGTWRLKAYNRYNDQNYYLRTAQTTQGVGIMYRRDFDKLFNFMKRSKHPVDTSSTEQKSPAIEDKKAEDRDRETEK